MYDVVGALHMQDMRYGRGNDDNKKCIVKPEELCSSSSNHTKTFIRNRPGFPSYHNILYEFHVLFEYSTSRHAGTLAYIPIKKRPPHVLYRGGSVHLLR